VWGHKQEFRVIVMCCVLQISRSGYYAWVKKPKANRAIENESLLFNIRVFFKESKGTYGSPRIHKDMQEAGFKIGLNRAARIMRKAGLKADRIYKKQYKRNIKENEAAPNIINQNFSSDAPNQKWVTDITQIRTYEGWLYLATVCDLYSRMIIGWSMQSVAKNKLVLDALLMAVSRRQPKKQVIIHSDQGSQFTSNDWKAFCKNHNLILSMSRTGNCLDNAVIESFYSTLKKEKIKGKVYKTRNQAKLDIFEYIETFYNNKRKHSYIGFLSPKNFEK
jgi:putative transposase